MANKRQKRLWTSIALTTSGVLLLAFLGWLRERRENTDLKDPAQGVTTEFRHSSAAGAPELEFVDVSEELGVRFQHAPGERGRTLPEDTGSGLAWGDYDGDGDDDLYLVNFTAPLGAEPTSEGANRLFRNDGGTFVDVSASAGVLDIDGFGMGASFADFDQDSDLDLFVTNYGPNRLFRNRGDGTFEEVAEKLGLAGDSWSIAPVWGDFDRDTRLDLYVTSYVRYDPTAPPGIETNPNFQAIPFTLNPNAFDAAENFLYQQVENGGFEEGALPLGVGDPRGRGLAASFVDLDLDGWLDLYVANDVSPNALFHNRGGRDGFAIFEDWSAMTGTADERGSMGISVADLAGPKGPRDGLPDVFISHWIAQENAFYVATARDERLEYRDRIRQYRLGEVSTDRVGWGSAWADIDLDGRLDLLVANGSTIEDDDLRLEAQPPFFFWNAGERFFDITEQLGQDAATPRVARGLAVSDFDLDGDVDVAISVNRGRALLLRNQGAPESAWIAVRLGETSARNIGSRIRSVAGDVADTRFRGADVSYASAHSNTEVFGLGNDDSAEVTVSWMGGKVVHFVNVPANHRVLVRH